MNVRMVIMAPFKREYAHNAREHAKDALQKEQINALNVSMDIIIMLKVQEQSAGKKDVQLDLMLMRIQENVINVEKIVLNAKMKLIAKLALLAII